jgi:hypothetical protein
MSTMNMLGKNSREQKIRGWLARVTSGTVALRLENLAEESPRLLSTWDRGEITVDLSIEILEAVDSCEEAGGGPTRLQMLDEDERPKKTHVIPKARGAVAESDVMETPELSGSAANMTIQAQRFAEMSMQMSMRGAAATLSQALHMCELANGQAERGMRLAMEAEARERALREERDALLDEMGPLRDVLRASQAEGGAEQSDGPGMEKLMKMLEPVMPMLLARVAGALASQPTPATSA